MVRLVCEDTILPSRIEEKIHKDANGCWLWTGARFLGTGYGAIRINGHTRGAHRIVFALLRGPIASRQHLHHICQRRHCVNPDHLEMVTPNEHAKRHPSPPTCPAGHRYTPENTYRWPGSRWRMCRKCHAARQLKRYHESKHANL